jgi:hypothetical protein
MIHLKTFESADPKPLYRLDSTPRWEVLNRNFFDRHSYLTTMLISFCQDGDCEKLMATPVVDYFGDLGTDPIPGKLAAKYLDAARELLEVLDVYNESHSGAIFSAPNGRMYKATTEGNHPKQAESLNRVLRANLADVHYLDLVYTEGEMRIWSSGKIQMLFLPDDWVAVYIRQAGTKRFTLSSQTFICDGLEGVKQLITDTKTKPKGS